MNVHREVEAQEFLAVRASARNPGREVCIPVLECRPKACYAIVMSIDRARSFTMAALAVVTSVCSSAEVNSDRQDFLKRFVSAAIERTHHTVRYVASYVKIPYPGGDVPADTGVCSDEVIRAFRAVGVDLQKEVHEDMTQSFSAYPHLIQWLALRPDANIDHRRVPNLMVFFSRKGESLPLSHRAEDYAPGELVTWDLGGNVPHIGIVVDQRSLSSGRYLIVHNVGQGPKMEDVLFAWKITGHYRYFGPSRGSR